MKIHYALQTCDSATSHVINRYTGTTKKEISNKCVTSFLNSVTFASKIFPGVEHIIKIYDYNSSVETLKYFNELIQKHSSDNVTIDIESIGEKGVMNSIRKCYDWLEQNGEDLVYQVQDDYLFHPQAIVEMLALYHQLKNELNTEPVISPYNFPYLWLTGYRNIPTPRAIFLGSARYWIQIYDISCSFMTSYKVFMENKDLRDYFLTFPDIGDEDGNLENKSVNRILTERGVLGVCPINSLALHLQSENEKDPYINWSEWWNKYTV